MQSNTLSKNITRISMLLFGKKIGIQEIRTIYCSRFQLQDEDCSIETIITDAAKMGHQISTHIKKYMKRYVKPK
jgi:extradiol dioxygenase family protein